MGQAFAVAVDILENTLSTSYAFYLLGKTQYHVPSMIFRAHRQVVYASQSLEIHQFAGNVMDGDLNRIKDSFRPESFISTLEKIITGHIDQ
jgi:hypothetical protein